MTNDQFEAIGQAYGVSAEVVELIAKAALYHDHRPRMPQATIDVLMERSRQIHREGWTEANDDEHTDGSLAKAAAAYSVVAIPVAANWPTADIQPTARRLWPWAFTWFKPTDARRNLVKAGALILAEIERLDRASAKGGVF